MDVTSFLFNLYTWVVLIRGKRGCTKCFGRCNCRGRWNGSLMWVGLGYLRVENDLRDLKNLERSIHINVQ